MAKLQTRRPSKKSLQKKLDAHLAHLETAQLVRRAEDIDPAYLFKHTLTQETVYESLLRSTRREIHARVAQTYEELYVDRLDEYAAPLAQHYAEAGDKVKTLEYSMRAGDVAARVYANIEAIMHYTRAIEIARRGVETPQSNDASLQELYLKRGRTFEHCGQHSQALANYQEMEALARERSDRAMELAALMARATLHATPTPLQNLELGRNLLDDALAFARELHDRTAESKIFWNLMHVDYFSGRQVQGAQHGEQALMIARKLNLQDQIAFVLNDIARTYTAIGRHAEASAALDEARELWQAMGNLPMLADNLATLADTAMTFGEYDHAIEYAEQANRVSQSIGNLWNQAYSRWILGTVYFDQGKIQKAIIALEEAMRLADPAGFAVAARVARVILALLYGSLGSPARGIALLESQVERDDPSVTLFQGWGLSVQSYLHLLAGDTVQAQTFLVQAQSATNRGNLGNLEPIVLALAEGAFAMAQGQFAQAEQLARQLLDRYRNANLRVFKSDMMLLAGRAAHAQGNLEAAFTILAQARAEAEMVGVKRTLWEILATLAEIETQRGNPVEAHTLREQSREIVEFIAAQTPIELRTAFLNLPLPMFITTAWSGL